MNRDIKSWCQETEERDRFWPCVSVVASLSCAVTVCATRACVCACVCAWGRLWFVLCVIETVKSERNEFLNIICSWVSRDCCFAPVHQGGKITFYCVCLCGEVKKMQEEGALHTLWFITRCPSPLPRCASVLSLPRVFAPLWTETVNFLVNLQMHMPLKETNIYVTVYSHFKQKVSLHLQENSKQVNSLLAIFNSQYTFSVINRSIQFLKHPHLWTMLSDFPWLTLN